MARHTRFCPFSSMASSPAFADPALDSPSLLEDFVASVKSMERFGRSVPRFTERTVSRITGARSRLVEYVLGQVRKGDRAEGNSGVEDGENEEEDVWKSRIVLALTGWELGCCGDALTTIKCAVCNRKRGAWECHTFETPLPPSNADEIFPAESDVIAAETVEEVVLEEVAAVAAEALSDGQRMERLAAEKDDEEEAADDDAGNEKEMTTSADEGAAEESNAVEETDTEPPAMEESVVEADEDTAVESKIAEENDTGPSAMEESVVEGDDDCTESSEDDGTESNEDGEKYVGKKHKALQRGDEHDDRTSANDDKMEDGSEKKSGVGSDSKAASEASGDERADGEHGEIADKDKEDEPESEEEKMESEDVNDGEDGEVNEGDQSENQMEVATNEEDDENSSQEEVSLPGRPVVESEEADEEKKDDGGQEEIVLPGSATGMEEADEDESDGANESSQEENPVLKKGYRSVLRLAMGYFGADREWDSPRRLAELEADRRRRGGQEEEDTEQEEEEEEESGDEGEEEEEEESEDDNEDDESSDEEDDRRGPVPAFQPKFAAPPAADSDSDVICLSSDDDDEQEKVRETKTEDTSSLQTTPMNSTMEEEEMGESSAEMGNSTVELGNSTVDLGNSTIEVQSSAVLDSTLESATEEEERGSSPIPNLDGTFDLLPAVEKAAHNLPPRKFFHPLDNHLPWCTWVRPTSSDPSVTGATALAIRLEHLVAKIAGVEKEPESQAASPAVNGAYKMTPEDKLKKVRDALNESY